MSLILIDCKDTPMTENVVMSGNKTQTLKAVCSRRSFLRQAAWAAAGMALGLNPRRISAGSVKPPQAASGLDYISRHVELVRRHEWNDSRVIPGRLKLADFFDRITVHHMGREVHDTVRNSVIHLLDGIQHAHMQRHFGDIGYHFAVDGAGVIWECRSLEYEGAHVSGQNQRNLGVVLLGNFDCQTMTGMQTAGLEKLLLTLRECYAVKRHRVYGHLELGSSVCPGRNAQCWLEDWRA